MSVGELGATSSFDPMKRSGISARFASCNAKLAGTYFSREEFREVYVIGDVHGDFTALIKCLCISRLVSRVGERWSWVGPPRTAVVLLGDTVDRFRRTGRHMLNEYVTDDGYVRTGGERKNEELQVVLLLDALSEQAEKTGSAVFRLFGNHEFMNYDMNMYDYVTPYALGLSENASAEEVRRAVNARAESFQYGPFRRYIGSCQPKAIIQIGSTVMCHGGIDDRLWAFPEVVRRMQESGMTLFELANKLASNKWRLPGSVDPLFNVVLNASTRRIPMAEKNDLYRNSRDQLPVAGILWDDQISSFNCDASHGHVCKSHTMRAFERANEDVKDRPEVELLHHICVAHCQQTEKGTALSGMVGSEDYGEEPDASDALRDEEDDTRQVFAYSPGQRTFADSSRMAQGINSECAGMVWRVDVGMSRAFRYKKAFAIGRAGKTEEEYAHILEAQRPQVLRMTHTEDGGERFAILKYKGNYSEEFGVYTGLGDDEEEPF